jgi:hypothetical protein
MEGLIGSGSSWGPVADWRIWTGYFGTSEVTLSSGVPRGGLRGSNPLRNSEVLTKLSRIPSSLQNTSVTV